MVKVNSSWWHDGPHLGVQREALVKAPTGLPSGGHTAGKELRLGTGPSAGVRDTNGWGTYSSATFLFIAILGVLEVWGFEALVTTYPETG